MATAYSTCSGGRKPIYWSERVVRCAWACGGQLKSCLFHKRAPFGVCGWLASPKYSPDLWGQPGRVPALYVRDEVWVFSSWGAYVTGMLLVATPVMLRRGPHLGELSGGNRIGRSQRWCHVYRRGLWLGLPCAAPCFWYKLRPFGGSARALRRLGLGLLPGWFCQ